MPKNIVSTGSTYRIFDESVRVFNDLPVGTYKVRFNPMAGFSLQKVDDLRSNGEKAYGTLEKRVKKIIRTFQNTTRSLGVLASGDKGMGKTMMLRTLADKARTELSIPVIIVDSNAPGLADFLDTIGESIVVFDEFEKVFRIDDEGEDSQSQFLGLFDGMSTTKRMYVVTVNEINRVSDYLINRPGRFHYHLRFDYPKADEVREYMGDNGIPSDQIDKVVSFTNVANVNYDHLRAIAFELSGGDDFNEIISDLNIKRTERVRYQIELVFDTGKMVSSLVFLDLGDSSGVTHFRIDTPRDYIFGSIALDKVTVGTNGISVPVNAVGFNSPSSVAEEWGKLTSVSVAIDRTNRVDF